MKIICFGKLKQEFKVLEQEYLKKLKSLDKIEIIELKECSGNSKEEILKKEENLVKDKLDNYIVLTEEGKNIDSREFSKLIGNKLTFVIGSSFGISENIKKKAFMKLSLSKMTFSHQLARVLLLEQIYRAHCIKKNLPYQKD